MIYKVEVLTLIDGQIKPMSMNKKVQQVKPSNTSKILREFDAQIAVEYEKDIGPTSSVYRLKDGRMMILGHSDN